MNNVRAKYISAGWSVLQPPKGSLNDFIAQRGKKLHFVQVVTDKTDGDASHSGLALNSFIQNAFSNGAIPVYARIDAGGKISFRDVNLNARILVTPPRNARPGDVAKQATKTDGEAVKPGSVKPSGSAAKSVKRGQK